MALGNDFDKLCPLFDAVNGSGGVPWVYRVRAAQAGHDGFAFGSAGTSAEVWFKFPFKVMLFSCCAWAEADAQGTKSGTGSTEPVIGISYAASANATFATAGDGTEIATITCDGTGDRNTVWAGVTTATVIEASAPIAAYIKTASGTASGTSDGAGVVDLFFYSLNSA